MAHLYSENASYWANSEAKQDSNRGWTKAQDMGVHKQDCESGLGDRIEPVRLTYGSPAAAHNSPAGHRSPPYPEDARLGSQSIDGEPPAEELPAESTPTASLLDVVQTPDPPEELTGQPAVHLQACQTASLQAEVSEQLSRDWPTATAEGMPSIADCLVWYCQGLMAVWPVAASPACPVPALCKACHALLV